MSKCLAALSALIFSTLVLAQDEAVSVVGDDSENVQSVQEVAEPIAEPAVEGEGGEVVAEPIPEAPAEAELQSTAEPIEGGDSPQAEALEPEVAADAVNTPDGDAVSAPEEAKSEEVTELQKMINSLRAYEVEKTAVRNPYARYRVVVEKKIKAPTKEVGGKKLGLLPLQQWELKELQLVGVIWGVEKPKAMIQDPSGKLHYVGKNGKMGLNDGYVAVIRDSEIVVVEAFNTEQGVLYQTQLMKVKR